jgi:hypothetical protein
MNFLVSQLFRFRNDSFRAGIAGIPITINKITSLAFEILPEANFIGYLLQVSGWE